MKPSRDNRRVRTFASDFFIGLILFIAIFALATFDTRGAHSAPIFVAKTAALAQADTLSPAAATSGTLLLRTPSEENPNALTKALRLETNVDISVTGPIARARVTQTFRNTTARAVEGLYAFPLPGAAKVDALSMNIGERIVKGEIKPRAEAHRMYRAAKNAGMKASLASQRRRNVFISAVTNIGPGEEITIRIEYQELLRGKGGVYSLRFPLTTAPRSTLGPNLRHVKLDGRAGVPGPNPRAGGRESEKNNLVSLQVRLDSGFPLGRVSSATHEIALRRPDDETAFLALSQVTARPDRDFELTWAPKDMAVPLASAFQEQIGENGYVLAMLTPPETGAAPASPSREVIFAIDTSGSMAGTGIQQARQSVVMALERLKPGDHFNIIRFDASFESAFDEPVALTQKSLAAATKFVTGLEAHGGTQIMPALAAALEDKRKKDTRRVRQVVFLTDGEISNEAELLSLLAAKRGRSRLFFVGIGPAPNAFLMRRAAEIGRGSFVHISSQAQIGERLTELFTRLERPVITDLKLGWAPGLRADAWPSPLPDLYAGEPIVIAARVSSLKGDLTVSGKIAGKPWTRTVVLSAARQGRGIGKFWARQKIASLETRRYAGQPASDVNAAIEAVALEHSLISRMTSMVPMDITPPRPQDQPLASEELPVILPAGWVYEETFTAPVGQAAAGQPVKLASNDAREATGGLAAPGADKASTRRWTLSVMALIFAVMTALTLGLWRHLSSSVVPRRDGRRRA